MSATTLESRFWSKVTKTETCWIWTGSDNAIGYGRISVDGRLHYAHRWSYEQARGPIPDGWVVDHLCRTPQCVNPSHLEAVTHHENNVRGKQGFGLTGMCRKGLHDVTNPDNVRQVGPARRCIACMDEYRRNYVRKPKRWYPCPSCGTSVRSGDMSLHNRRHHRSEPDAGDVA
jgi:hypothetical protein